ncbi:PRC-barrel domain-containing protein [Bradyrhizobium sp. WYCCWR 13022]|uniref:PRC-barrel domain-containing protein n=1 Tax=unclassified Bradyrhizobium TaxID=2631580 RepID=UPI00263A4653|nr:PRC-barrel domain-containing protein [Bradyrhizobium sp. WYCCWR 13022]MDN4986257.1 PRC-barrel domain-containing protein [Bradyrhizobium sp. WYCCWR 13022]
MNRTLCIIASAMLMATPAMAQAPQSGATATAPNMQSSTASTASMHKQGEWRASKLVGVNVYNNSNEKIGDINDLILDSSGRVASVVIGVGGFLGMGEHNVAVTFDQLKFSKEPAKTASNDATGKTGTASSVTTGSAATSANRTDNWYPDHVVLNADKDQLKKMPEFKY